MEMRLLAVACMVGLIGSVRLAAICPAPPPPCEALAQADVVFVADVIELTVFANDRLLEGLHQIRFDVIEAFKGVKPAELWALFYSGLEKDSFARGVRYLIFANRRPTGAFVSGCSLTRQLRGLDAGELGSQLRACK